MKKNTFNSISFFLSDLETIMLTILWTLFMIYSSSILLPFFRLIYDVFDFLLFSGIILFSSLHCCGLKVSYEMLLLISSTILAHSINVWRAFDRKINNKTEQNCCGTNPHLWLSTCAFCNPIILNLIMKFIGLVALFRSLT